MFGLDGGTKKARVPIFAKQLAQDAAVAGNTMGAATEVAMAAHTIPAQILGVARRKIRYRAKIYIPASVGTDTFRFRVRIGATGVAGVLVADTTAIDVANGNVFTIEGELDIRTLGSGGTFDSVSRLYNPVAATSSQSAVTAGALNTTVARDLTVTAECSANASGDQAELRSFEVEAFA